jgi:hypothetical protein
MIRHLGLHGHEALDRRRGRKLDAVEEHLAREQGAIQCAPAKDFGAAGHGPILAGWAAWAGG